MSNGTDDFRHRSLPEQVADHIVVLIAKGQIKAGDRLFENDLCKMLGVSRIPVREALRILQAQGVLRTEPNRGSFVSEYGSAETTEMLKVRLTVERLALRRLVPMVRRDPELLVPLRRAIDQLRDQTRLRNKLASCQADLEFHHRMVELSESPTLLTVWEMLARGILVFFMHERHEYYDHERNIRDHERLVEAIEAGRLAPLDDLIEEHILKLYPVRAAEAGSAAVPTPS
ncbi:GntR family transcriptional regulator [Ancylobacter terrae]|uniref:GntR family transcriptional regulator n=1 Tax=Ancylobacter sp. sgz301288 TaxID=3342077 RepID=UPI00385990B1